MPITKLSQVATFAVALLGATYLVVFDNPFIMNVVFTILAVAWSAWIFISIFRGSDELESASVRYAFAFASGVGVPISLAFIMLMITMPGIQSVITHIASLSNNGLSPAAAGFGLGVTFTISVLCVVFAVGHTIWWTSKR